MYTLGSEKKKNGSPELQFPRLTVFAGIVSYPIRLICFDSETLELH